MHLFLQNIKHYIFTIIALTVMVLFISSTSIANIRDHEDVGCVPNETLSVRFNNSQIIVDDTIDLQGRTYFLPYKSNLNFKKGGIIINGILHGDSTLITHLGECIFDSIILEGSWIINNIATDLFKTRDSHTLSNMSVLTSDKIYNTITINHNCFTDIKEWGSHFKIKSFTKVIFNADIYTNKTTFKGGYCMQTVGQNIQIIGNGHYLFGSLANPAQESCWEWLHGLKISKECKNISIEKLNTWLFPGDGFSIQGSDIHISNVNSRFNGRQGMSITQGRNIYITDSEFTFTSFYRLASGQGPGAGIDIEPDKGNHVDSIKIIRCLLDNNFKYMNGHVNDIEIYNTGDAEIEIIGCKFSGLYLGDCANVNIIDCSSLNSIFCINNNITNITISNSGRPCIYSRHKYNEIKGIKFMNFSNNY